MEIQNSSINSLSTLILRQESTAAIGTILKKVFRTIIHDPSLNTLLTLDHLYMYLEITNQYILQHGTKYPIALTYIEKLIDIIQKIGLEYGIALPDNMYEILGCSTLLSTPLSISQDKDTNNHMSSTSSVNEIQYSNTTDNAPITNQEGGYLTYSTNTKLLPLYTFHIWSSICMSDIADRLWPAAFTLVNACYHINQYYISNHNNNDNNQISFLNKRSLLELGSGTGLAGGVISMILPDILKIHLTDVEYHSYTKMVQFQKNLYEKYPSIIQTKSDTTVTSRLTVGLLDWCKLADDLDRYSSKPVDWKYENDVDPDTKIENDLLLPIIPPLSIRTLRNQYNVIIGSDLVYDPLVIPQLCQTLESLLIPLLPSSDSCSIPLFLNRSIFQNTSDNLSTTIVSLPALYELLDWLSKQNIRFSILSTTYRNPSTYTLLQENIKKYNLLYIDITKDISALMNKGENNSNTSVLDMQPITEALIYHDILNTLQLTNPLTDQQLQMSFSSTELSQTSKFDERTAILLHKNYIQN